MSANGPPFGPILPSLSGCYRSLREAIAVVVCFSLASSTQPLPYHHPLALPATVAGFHTDASTTPADVSLGYRTCLDVMSITGLSQDGYFNIDPDGPGHVPAFQVFCQLSSTHQSPGTTVIRTTNNVRRFVDHNHRFNITYENIPDLESIRALIKASAACRQRVSYTCYGLPLWLNGTQQVAWVAWNGMEMLNWGGGQTGVKGCACHSKPTGCLEGGLCNCDSVTSQETDSGFITDKDTLPVTGVEFKYTNLSMSGPNSRAEYKVEQLECFGAHKMPEVMTALTTENILTSSDALTTERLSTEAQRTISVISSTTTEETTPEETISGLGSSADDALLSSEVPPTTVSATSNEVTMDYAVTARGDGSTTIHTTMEDLQTTGWSASTFGDETTSEETTDRISGGHAPTETLTTIGAIRVTDDSLKAAETTASTEMKTSVQETTKQNRVQEIENSLQKRLEAIEISAGNTSTDILMAAAKDILGTTLELLSNQDNDVSTKMSVTTIVESSLGKVAVGLRQDEVLQLSVGDTKVEVTAFASSESLEKYIFNVAGGELPKNDEMESKDINDGKEKEVTLRISTGASTHVEGPVKVLVVYQGVANRTGNSTAGEWANTGPGFKAVSRINSGILSCSVISAGQPLDLGLTFSLQHQQDPADKNEDQIVTRQCCFWNATLETWSSKGCRTMNPATAESAKTTCFCSHNTSFAVLLQVTERSAVSGPDQMPGHDRTLSLLSTIFGSLSVISLAFTLILYSYLRLFKFLQIKVHANLVVSLLVAQVLFLAGTRATENLTGCRIITVLLQLFFSASFSWMLVEGGLLLQRAVMVSRQPPKILILMLIGWGIPSLVTLTSFSIGYKHYGIYGLCWLTAHKGQIWAFATLVIAVTLVNVVVVCIVLKTFLSLKMNMNKDNAHRVRASFRAVVVLVPILGLTWIFGLLGNASTAFKYIFVILNSTQGIFVFICHGLMNIEVQKAMKRRHSNKVSSSASSSNPSHLQSANRKTATTMASEGVKKEDQM
ncbi:adhesion G protein-coupled receptor L3-like [Acanthaster planci]|uniref:Adhesion G protein-coupled receptor L3-like n=1 Tax=Acanthaster planci TaxID=133434 RepID=A0A8B7Z6F8_ACAPL|nr:adhesion G protein-coupled receptor L3-like [Acanthaster planci]